MTKFELTLGAHYHESTDVLPRRPIIGSGYAGFSQDEPIVTFAAGSDWKCSEMPSREGESRRTLEEELDSQIGSTAVSPYLFEELYGYGVSEEHALKSLNDSLLAAVALARSRGPQYDSNKQFI